MVGEVIADRYELEELVGTGGMSSVFRAHDALLERRVALKLLHDHVARDEEQVERFRREARAVAQLSHPNIVTVIDRGERDGRQYIVFEYVEGENLKQLVVRNGPLPVRRALEVALQVGRALAFAHHQGLVHRDVKPQNVLLPVGGEVKVTDFGIARSLDVEGLTQTGSVVGTSHYIAPEQARGQPVDPRTDVYSLGAVLYELVTGEVPFPGESFVAVALRHVNEPPPSAREHRPDVSPRLDGAVGRAMAKDPAQRFRSMDEFVAELEECLVELGPDTEREETMVVPAATAEPTPARAPPIRPRRRRALPLGLGALAALAAAAVVSVVYFGLPDVGGDGNNGGGGGSPPAAHLQAVPLRAARTWDPEGDGSEHDDSIGQATDSDPATYWTTEGYDAGLGDKSGVGVVLDAGREASLAEVRVTSDTPGFTAEIRTGSSSEGPFKAVTRSAEVGRAHTFHLEQGTKARYVLVWITKLAHPDKYRAHLNEVTAKG
jgi:tRNA A-37 threonylcarbamoyl transferase component Bud32